MPLAPREVDAIFSACDVTACLSINLLTETNHRPTKHHPAYTQPYITTQNYTTTTPTRPPMHQPCYQVDGNGSIDWTEFAAAFREALQESPFRQGDFWKGG